MTEYIWAESDEQVRKVGDLIREYVASLPFDECFEDMDKEIAELPGAYTPPAGRLLLAVYQGEPVGCVAMRKLGDGICEMKRMFVRPAFRREGIGRSLAQTLIEEARSIGYRRMRLDTAGFMAEAIALYRSLGFQEIEPYCYNPLADAVFMELPLR
jgi:ribosomal protein S18 acetylase RimI-like enzyme